MKKMINAWNSGAGHVEPQKFTTQVWILPRVADPVHFRPDPDPANQNFNNRIRILLALSKNQLKHPNFFHMKHIFFDI